MSADIARNLWSLVCSCVNSYYKFHLFTLLILFQTGCFLHWTESLSLILFFNFPVWNSLSVLYPSGLLCWWIFIAPEVALNLVFPSSFLEVAGLMRADIARHLWPLVCSCPNSYYKFHFCHFWYCFKHDAFLQWIEPWAPLFPIW